MSSGKFFVDKVRVKPSGCFGGYVEYYVTEEDTGKRVAGPYQANQRHAAESELDRRMAARRAARANRNRSVCPDESCL